jgi:nitrate reductase NapE component
MFVTTFAGLVLIGIAASSGLGSLGPMLVNPVPGSFDWIALAPTLGFIGIVVGSIWMYRIVRDDPEPDQLAWRYRSGEHLRDRDIAAARLALHEGDPDDADGMTPGQRGRWIGRGLIAIAILAIGLSALWVIATPGIMGSPMLSDGARVGPLPAGALLLLVGAIGIVGGLVWMIRIHRADPEPDQHAWRYRSRGR